MIRHILAFVLLIGSALQVAAQELSWIQLEARPTLSGGQESARRFAAELPDVNGFYLGNGWYVVALGPYAADDADAYRRELRRAGTIPRDAFVSDGSRFGQQYWPIGVGAPTSPLPLPSVADRNNVQGVDDVEVDISSLDLEPLEEPVVEEPVVEEEPTIVVDPVIEPEPEPVVIDETPAEARASESQLSGDERKELQIALAWAGFYNSGIDGAFGRGTRSSMADWQVSKGYEGTGVLTTRQRAELLSDYNAVLEGTGLERVRNERAGVSIMIPTAMVGEPVYEAPFVRYEAKDGSGVQVLLISGQGDRQRLYGLYEILQTLQIVPTEGQRGKNGDRFEINGSNDSIHTYISASTNDRGVIKGFGLVWPAGDEERRTRVLAKMQESFNRIEGVLDAAMVPDEALPSTDLLAGLEIRKPQSNGAGMFVNGQGAVLTAAANVGSCEYVTLDDTHRASVVWSDDRFAVLQPDTALAPIGQAEFQLSQPRLADTVAVAGYPYGGVLRLPAVTFGGLNDLTGLNGEADVLRLEIEAHDGDVGGPVFDQGGAVIGMLMPKAETNTVLPESVNFAADAAALTNALGAAGITAKTTDMVGYMPPETLTGLAADVTALVSCW